jgi:hypothetical protein
VFELMLLKLKLFDPIFSGQGTVAPSFPTAFDFLASISSAATVFTTTDRPLFPDIARCLDSTEILAFLSSHHPRPIAMKKPAIEYGQICWGGLALQSRAPTLREIPLGINYAERIFYHLLECSTA